MFIFQVNNNFFFVGHLIAMKCLRSLVGVLRMDRVRNEEVLTRAGIGVRVRD